jgi:dynein heavy chain, axonemal
MQKLKQTEEKAKKFNQQELLTGEEETNYQVVKDIVADFTPFYELWTTIETWENCHKLWRQEDFDKLDPMLLEETVDNAKRLSAKCIKFFRSRDNMLHIQKIAETIRDKVQDFEPHKDYIMALRVDGMKDRHWDAISDKVGQVVKPYPGFTLKNVLEMNLKPFQEDIIDIGEKASKQYKIECDLAKMKGEWEEILFGLKPFK